MSFTENRSPRHTSLYNLWKQTLMILLSCKGNLCYYKITFNLLFLFSSLCQFDSGRDHIGCVIVSVLDGSAVAAIPWREQVTFDEKMKMFALYKVNTLSWIIIAPVHWSNSQFSPITLISSQPFGPTS
jgi:hypothetical protein